MLILGRDPKISIYASPGIYFFGPEAGTGKTYLYKCIKKLSCEDNSLTAYTYSDYYNGISLKERFEKFPPRVVVIDRFDLFRDDTSICEALMSVMKSAVVLIDLKNINGVELPIGFAGIDLQLNELEVYCGAYF